MRISVIEAEFYVWCLLTTLTAVPFIHYIGHILCNPVTYPRHQLPVKFEIWPALNG